jgi:predicted ATP-grasp superfamily ATP-dependent carboligase
MNIYYTGLGIARSLGERGISVIGLTNGRWVYGNFTRYAKIIISPDSRSEPDALLPFLLELGRELGTRAIIFPTRDDDLVFLDRFRKELEPYFRLVLPGTKPLKGCLDKWETALWAERAAIATPKCWLLEGWNDVSRIASTVSYPSVLKPVSAHHWRRDGNWHLVGARKAVPVGSEEELFREYEAIARADKRALLQELIPGGDENLIITACYLDQQSRWIAGFNIRKLVQIPEGFGTGCIVDCTDRPELFEPARHLLQTMGFSGIAEVEFKLDTRDRQYKLIEVNPRPWDQHRLGNACGVDLIYIAYCEHAGRPVPPSRKPVAGYKWIADDTFLTTALRMLWRRDRNVVCLFRHARGKKILAIGSLRDPMPLIACLFLEWLPSLLSTALHHIARTFHSIFRPAVGENQRGLAYDNTLGKSKNLS